MFEEIIAIAIIVLAVGGAVTYIVKTKRRGQKCIGCPYAKSCGQKCTCNIDIEKSNEESKKAATTAFFVE